MDTTFFNLLAEVKGETLWFPIDAAKSNEVDGLAYFILWICAFFLVFNAGLMVYFAIRYRQKKKAGTATGQTHNTALEVTWSVIPAFILAIIFIWGFRGFLKMEQPPDDAYDILVTGYSWGWDFTYPDGINAKPMGDQENVPGLHVPAGRPIRLTLQSNDVIHSVSIPQMRVKKDCVPGRFNQMWFEAKFDDATAEDFDLPTEDGGTVRVRRNVYDLFCTEYCGQNHSMMITKVYVYEQADYDKWYVSKALVDPSLELVKHGEKLWAGKCQACHSIDGKAGLGPSWQNLFGAKQHATSAGPVDVDSLYIIESIRIPGAKLAQGYGNAMPAFSTSQLSERDVRSIIEYMKSVSDKADADDKLIYGDLEVDGTLKAAPGEGEAGAEGEAEPQGEAEEPEAEAAEPAAGAASR